MKDRERAWQMRNATDRPVHYRNHLRSRADDYVVTTGPDRVLAPGEVVANFRFPHNSAVTYDEVEILKPPTEE